MKYGEDTLWRFHIGLYTDKIIQCTDELYLYRYVPTSAMHNKSSQKRKDWVESMKMMLEEYCKIYRNPSTLPQNKIDNLKGRIEWSVNNVLFGSLSVNEQYALENLNQLKKCRLYPTPIQWSRLIKSVSFKQFLLNMFLLPFPIEAYYRLVLKLILIYHRK